MKRKSIFVTAWLLIAGIGFSNVAAAQGTVAAVKIHASLWEEDLRARASSV